MYVNVLLQIGHLTEPHVTVIKGAGKRFSIRVDVQVVKEIMPLPENFLTIVVLAQQHSYQAPRFTWELILKYDKVVSVWR